DRPLGGRLPRPGVQLPHGGPRRGRRPGDGGRARALSRRHLRRARGGRARPSVSPRACSATQESHPQSVAPSPLDLLTGTVSSRQRKRGGTPMHQRQPRHLRSGAALASVLALVGILGLAPRAGHAQGQCATQFQEQTSGTVADGGTICATAVGNKCTFQLDLCGNQSGASSSRAVPKDLACGRPIPGGGGNTVPLPYAVPDRGSSLTGVSACSGTALTLANIKPTDPGATIRNCTSVGCLFGPPLPIPNPGP